MTLIDFILNVAALLLWLSWRSLKFDPLVKTTASSLAGTLRRAEPARLKGWQLLLGLLILLALRALAYWQVGAPANWVPKLDLAVVVLAFRSDTFFSTLSYSALSFGRILFVFYFWLLFLVLAAGRRPETDPVEKMLRLHLGSVARWPRALQAVLPLLLVTAVWMALHPLLLHLDVLGHAASAVRLAEQGFMVGLGLYLSLKYLLPALLLLHLVGNYVYLGNNPLWDFLGAAARNLLEPLRWLPLKISRLDLAPVVGILLIVLLFYWPVPGFVHKELAAHQLTLWPQ